MWFLAFLFPIQGPAWELPALLERLADPLALARADFPFARTQSFTSFDRRQRSPERGWFADQDRGAFLRRVERSGRSEWLMAEADGPGAITRLFLAPLQGVVRIYVDGEPEPTWSFAPEELARGALGVPTPLVEAQAGGLVLSLPIAFARHLEVTTDAPNELEYQVQVSWAKTGTSLASFAHDTLAQHAEPLARAAAALGRTGYTGELHRRAFEALLSPANPGAPLAELELRLGPEAETRGPAALCELSLSIEPLDDAGPEALAPALRRTLVELEFDGQKTISVPAGDLFGGAHLAAPFRSRWIERDPEGRSWFRLPMPYREGALLRVRHLGDGRVWVRGSIGVQNTGALELWPLNAEWSCENPFATLPTRDWRVLALAGEGRYVGDVLVCGTRANTRWRQGDERVWIDGERFPSHLGTSVDAAYGFGRELSTSLIGAWSACTRLDRPEGAGHAAFARWRGLDALGFRSSLQIDLEWAPQSDHEAQISRTSFWYGPAKSTRPSTSDLARAGLRAFAEEPFRIPGALEGELAAAPEHSPGLERTVERSARAPWSEGGRLVIAADAAGEFAVLAWPTTVIGPREIVVRLSRGSGFGRVRCAVQGSDRVEEFDGFSAADESTLRGDEALSLGLHVLDGRELRLRFEACGSDPNSAPPHFAFAVDAVELRSAGS